MTPQVLIDAAATAADQIDAEQPGLRESGSRLNGVPVWVAAVAARANTNLDTDVFGTKDAGEGRPRSYDTIGIKQDNIAGFYAVSLCRDAEGYPRRLIDYGEARGQRWYAVPPESKPEPPPPPTPEPPIPPDDDNTVIIINMLTALTLAVARLSAEHQAGLAEFQAAKAKGATLETPLGNWTIKL